MSDETSIITNYIEYAEANLLKRQLQDDDSIVSQ